MTAAFDPYHELPDPDNTWRQFTPGEYTDGEYLRMLADWFDLQDQLKSVPPEHNLVQRDLRRMARRLDREDGEVTRLRSVIERLGSMEAFDIARFTDLAADRELIMRIDFAREALK